MRLVTLSGASAKTSAITTGSSAVSRKSGARAAAPPATHAPTQALRVNVSDERDDERRHDQRRPDPIARPEDQARRGGAEHQHQRARVGHVVRERALGPLPQAVVVQHAVLNDAEGGAGRADGR